MLETLLEKQNQFLDNLVNSIEEHDMYFWYQQLNYVLEHLIDLKYCQ